MEQHKTIFVVDDDEDDRMLIVEALTNVLGAVRIIEAVNAEALTGLLVSAPVGPKLILMDMNMPRVNGLEMLLQLKVDSRYQHIPVVMISTTNDQRLIGRAYECGANAFIIKPVTFSEYERMALGIGLCYLNMFRLELSMPELDGENAIIVVEENDEHWSVFRNALHDSPVNYRLIRINTKKRAMDFVDNELAGFFPAVSIILIDLYLPAREDGLELVSYMRRSLLASNLKNIPIIVFTYSQSGHDADDSYRASANAYLIKPSDISGWRFYFENVLAFWSKALHSKRQHLAVAPIKTGDPADPFRFGDQQAQ